jgi:hypothetical protein
LSEEELLKLRRQKFTNSSKVVLDEDEKVIFLFTSGQRRKVEKVWRPASINKGTD